MGMQFENLSDVDLLTTLCGSVGRRLARTMSLPEMFGLTSPRQTEFFVSDERTPYVVLPRLAVAKELYLRAIKAHMEDAGIEFSSPGDVQSFLCGRIGNLEYEVFWCLFLDSQNRLICAEELFRGTLTKTSVYPREVVKVALKHNAAACIFAHNHPSRMTSPSLADEALTKCLKTALALVDVKVLDHFVIAGNKAESFAELGLL